MKNKYTSFIAAIGWFFLVTFLLCLPGKEFPQINWLNKIWFDKWVHFGLFFILVITWCWFFAGKIIPGQMKKYFLVIALLSLTYGIAMEIVQGKFIPFRSFDIGDILADGAGVLGGYLFSIRKFIKK